MHQPLYDDHQTHTQSTSDAASGDVMMTTTATDQQVEATVEGGPSGLSSSSTTTGTNPVESFIATSSWSREDLQIALSAVSIALWVCTTIYVAKS